MCRSGNSRSTMIKKSDESFCYWIFSSNSGKKNPNVSQGAKHGAIAMPDNRVICETLSWKSVARLDFPLHNTGKAKANSIYFDLLIDKSIFKAI